MALPHPIWPQSSGKVEKANHLIKSHLTKLSIEICHPWPELLPLTLTSLRALPRKPTQLSPFELVYGRPLILHTLSASPSPLGDYFPCLSLMRSQLWEAANSLLPKPFLTSQISKVHPGDLVYLKTRSPSPLQPSWMGPHLVILSTPTAVRLQDKPHWYHLSLSLIKLFPSTELKQSENTQSEQSENTLPDTISKPQFKSTLIGPTSLRISRICSLPAIPEGTTDLSNGSG